MATAKRRSSAKKSSARKPRATASPAKVSVGAQGDVGIRYPKRPSPAALKALYTAGFRYYRGTGWFAPPSSKALALAKRLNPRFNFS